MLPLRDHLPTRTVPFVNYALIAANVLVFLGELNGVVGNDLEFVPARLFRDPAVGVETLFIAMFMHAGLAHIGGNMLYLWIFGDNVEDAMGHFQYLAFYLVGGVCAALAQTAVDPMTTVPMLGASGAIAAVLAAYVFLYPHSPVTVLNPIPLLWLFWGLFLQFPAWIVIASQRVAETVSGRLEIVLLEENFANSVRSKRAVLVRVERLLVFDQRPGQIALRD